MDRLILNNINHQLGTKDDDLLWSKVDVIWSDLTTGAIKFDIGGSGVDAILIVAIYAELTGSTVPLTIVDKKFTAPGKIIWQAAWNIYPATMAGAPFYYLIKDNGMNFLGSETRFSYGFNYYRITKYKSQLAKK